MSEPKVRKTAMRKALEVFAVEEFAKTVSAMTDEAVTKLAQRAINVEQK